MPWGDARLLTGAFVALSTIPALLYTFIERGILGMNTAVLGSRYGEDNYMAYGRYKD